MSRKRARTKPEITLRKELKEPEKNKLPPQCLVVYESLLLLKKETGRDKFSQEEVIKRLELEKNRLHTVQEAARIFQYYRSRLVRSNVITVS